MHPAFAYTASRIGVLAVTAGVLYLLGLRDPFLLLVASFLVSGVASYVLLSKQRDALSARITKNR
ncbi:DUF4229 domain-containing protein [Planomonospora sp. ID91781]|uniref:DUF4229 domain-containing protein n=3 Tax=Planomonospora TaxID=1998 RepID=A0A171DDC5_9ACTN|nr:MULTISPECIES: DUF4229 domain-containing protein [Planomonospora]MBG0820331.1 DUF4229 domain-containing protein [Planomonospora sp. ID91781]GAT68047.1 hypothetical protein PS9374_03708 [Planomonospora sphaerica]GGK79679.1 hypothetical protein GCM10010126_43770 [Planomonospora parontospora]GII11240.1 hypothetical protein Ppa06_50380 [Planomonospora parontospora subsp. parontospora]